MTTPITILFRSRTPQHYVARRGAAGWQEGWGWTVDMAIRDLARAVAEHPLPDDDELPSDRDALVAWLRSHAGEPVLAD